MESKRSVGIMEEVSAEELMMPKDRRTASASASSSSSSSYRSPCDLVEGAISAVLKCLGLGPFCWPFSKRREDNNTHQNVSYDPPPSSTDPAQDSPSVSERGMKTSEDVAVKSTTVRTRRPKPPPVSSGGGSQHN